MKKKVIRLNENDIENLVKKILRESDFDWAKRISYTEEEEFIINLIDSCEKEPYKDGLLYTKDGKKYFYQDNNKRFFFYYYVIPIYILQVLYIKFGLNNQEVRNLIESVLERHYNLREYTVLKRYDG
jgi:hypothetical protein